VPQRRLEQRRLSEVERIDRAAADRELGVKVRPGDHAGTRRGSFDVAPDQFHRDRANLVPEWKGLAARVDHVERFEAEVL
jgi:hypothetical protein